MTKVLQVIPLSNNNDIPRFIKIIENLQKEGVLKTRMLFDSTKHMIKELRDESDMFEHGAGNAFEELKRQIMAKHNPNKHVDYIEGLKSRYCGGRRKQNGGEEMKNDEEDSDSDSVLSVKGGNNVCDE